MSSYVIRNDQIHAAAMAEIPGYTEATTEMERGRKWLIQHKTTALPVPNAEAELMAAARAGDTFPAGLGLRIHEARNAIAAHLNETNELETFVRLAGERQRGAVERGADSGLSFLDNLLQDLVEDVRDNEATFRNLPRAAEIVADGDADALKAHGHLGDLTARYAAIRDTQAAIVRMAMAGLVDDNGRNQLLRGGQLRDAIDREAHYTAQRAYPWTENQIEWGSRIMRWRHAAGEPALYAVSWRAPLPGDPDAQARAVLEACTRAQPWVPSVGDMVEAARLADRATSVPDRSGDGLHVDALHQLAKLTGHDSPATPQPRQPAHPAPKRTIHKQGTR